MYYSYIEIEYIATSFSPARTDLALKLLTNNSPPTPNSAPLHKTEMINNVVQDINENNKVFINKMFDRRDKEINTLKCKVDKLNKDCVVLTKNNDQLRGLSNGLKDVLKK